jgi:hypothetical protein
MKRGSIASGRDKARAVSRQRLNFTLNDVAFQNPPTPIARVNDNHDARAME